MKVTLLQTDIAHADVLKNISAAEALLLSAPGADLYVLPEMFTTGYELCPAEVAEREPVKGREWMLSMARQTGACIAGSIACQVDGAFRNRFIVAYPDGHAVESDKRHLFSYGGEDQHYQAGAQRVVATIGGLRCLILVCYDLRFPVWSRCVDRDYDAIIYVANWPESRIGVWDILLQARAIENQAYVVAVNRVGTEGRIAYCGHSVILDPRGRQIASCPDGELSTATAELDPHHVEEMRNKFPMLLDADSFSLKDI